jgi:cobalt-zinc-cadmium efflux system outer membrane protein
MEQSLDFWGRRSARGRAGQLRAAAADTRALTEAARVEEETTLAFLAAVAAGWQESAATRTLAAFDRAVRITNERRAAGDAAGLDAKRLQLERTRALARLVAARHDHRSSLTRLATLVGRPPVALDSMRLVMDSTPNFLPQLAFDSLERAMRTTPSELDALAFEAEASEHDITGFRKAQTPIPSLRLGAKWERSDNTASRRGIAAGLSIPIPIWNSGGGAVEAARAELDVREALRDTNARERQASLAETWEGLTGHAAAFLELDRQIAANGSSLRTALDVAFAEGELSLTEWLDALRTDQETTSLHAELWLELAGRLARLERLTGLAFFQETS